MPVMWTKSVTEILLMNVGAIVWAILVLLVVFGLMETSVREILSRLKKQ